MPGQASFRSRVPTVSELTAELKELLESSFPDVLVEGEISNVTQSRNGHLYFTVKDRQAQLPCVMWKSTADRTGIGLLDGQQVILGGSIQLYPPHGRYQLIVNRVEQAGTGRLQEAFEQLKKKLREEGLFDEKRKRPLPPFPRRIGVVTSATGAAFHDIRSTLERRWPLAELLLYHSSVQGGSAAAELVRGIRWFSETQQADLLIVGRGGGSLEDLWPFNEEAVARAIYECRIPVISAVGHEVDFSISDFVADLRAATPTQAAVLAVPDLIEVRFAVDDLARRLNGALDLRLERYRETLLRFGEAWSLRSLQERVATRAQRIQLLRNNLDQRLEALAATQREQIGIQRMKLEIRMEQILHPLRERLAEQRIRLEKNDPDAPLRLGYTRVWQDQKWIRNLAEFSPGEEHTLEWKDGTASVKKQG